MQNKDYILPDANGLHLLIKTHATKLWVIRYTLHGKARKNTAGKYPTITLSEARSRRDKYKEMAAKGIDPVETKHEEKRQEQATQKGQFHLVVKEWSDSLSCKDITRKKYDAPFFQDQ